MDAPDSNPVEAVKRVPGAIKRLPPWVIFTALGAAVLVGLWLRSQRKKEERTENGETSSSELSEGAYSTGDFTPDMSAYYGGAGGEYGYPISFPTEVGFRNIPSLPSAQGAPTPTEPGGEKASREGITINVGTAGMTGGGPPGTPEPTQLRAPGVASKTPTINQRIQAAIHDTHEKKAAQQGTVKSRSKIEALAQKHPEWGPHTLAHGGKLRGHSTRF